MNRIRHISPLICSFLVGLCAVVGNAHAAGRALEVSAIDHQAVSLTGYFGVLEDPGLSLTAEDVAQADLAGSFVTGFPAGEGLSFGFTRSAYWLRLSLRNDSDRPVERMLEFLNSRLSYVHFHRRLADGTFSTVATGSALPFDTREYGNRGFVFPVTLQAKEEAVLFVRIESASAMLIAARLWAPAAFHAYERNDYVVQAWYFGLATGMVLFNLLLFIALRERIYLLYVGFVSLSSLTMASQNGLAKEYVWPNTQQWSEISTYVGYSVSVAALLLFMRIMLSTAKELPKLDRLVLLLVATLILMPLGFTVAPQAFTKPAALLYAGTMMLVLGTGVYCAFQRRRVAYFFVAAFAMLCSGAVLSALRGLGVLPTNGLTENALQVGSALEMLLLAFALADRFNEIRRDKEKAQHAALTAQQGLVENLQMSERILEERVKRRTASLNVSQQKLQGIVDTALDAVVQIDAHGVIIGWNARAQALFGWSAAEAVGLNLQDTIVPVQHRQAHAAGLERYTKTRDSRFMDRRIEITAIDRAGREFPIELAITRVPLQDPGQFEFCAFIHDISLRKQAEQEIKNSLDKQQQLNQMKSRFVAMASHEFRTPLATIMSSTELVSHYFERMSPPDRANLFQTIVLAVNRMNRMLEDILTIGKSEAEGLECKRSWMALPEFCAQLIDELQASLQSLGAAHRTIALQFTGENHQGQFDEKLMRHILGNLLSNAVKYSPNGQSVEFRVDCAETHCTFTVTDYGIGIPAADLPQLFGSFHRASNVGNIAGTGLGLAIVKRSVELHGGTISVVSEAGVSTSFTVVIPRADHPESPPDTAAYH